MSGERVAVVGRKRVRPPRIPEEVPELERAILLLGNRKRSDLRTKAREELTSLIGAYPSLEEASTWKSALAQVKKGRAG